MRLANRALAAVLALALTGAAGIVIVEVVARLVGRGPLVTDWTRVGTWADTTTWQAPAVLVGGVVALVLGLVLLVAELTPARPARFAASPGVPGVDTGYTRRGVAGAVRAAAEGVDGVSRASVSVGRRAVKVTATATATTTEVARGLTGPVTDAVTAAVDRLRLADRPRISVTTRAGRS